MTTVLVLSGGNSDEREVSLRSGASVTAALEKAGYAVKSFDTAEAMSKDVLAGCDVVFPVLHGVGGEDGSIQATLDEFGVRYVGTGAAASKMCFDKWQYKQLLIENGLPTPRGELVDEAAFWSSELIKSPFALKPNDGGSSIDNLIDRNPRPEPDKATVSQLFSKHPEMLLEELIVGQEITLPVLGQDALPVIEIIPPESGEFDYENKYNGTSQEICPPQNVNTELQQKAQEMAVKIHELAGCKDFSRTDTMIDSGGNLYVLETNTIPGMTEQSLFPKAAQAAGISMPELVDRLVKLSLNR